MLLLSAFRTAIIFNLKRHLGDTENSDPLSFKGEAKVGLIQRPEFQCFVYEGVQRHSTESMNNYQTAILLSEIYLNTTFTTFTSG